ncbi:hypothetical protein K2Q08_02080 [Patescibacteria group bacterium]|nr:hypothetical protein [Patescibacteria group bacterium]
MNTVRNTLLILFAIVIDLLQAGISAGLFVMGAFPGTVGGAAGGCLIGHRIAGEIGCWIGSVAAGVAGSAVNAASIATLPFAVGLGFAVNFCIDVTLGLVLVGFLIWLGMYYKGIGIGGFIVELVPGLGNIPGWTFMTILCVMRKTAEEKQLAGASGGSSFTNFITAGVAGMGAFAANTANSEPRRVVRQQGVYTQEEQDGNLAEKKQFVSTELKNIDGIRAKNQPYAA